MVESLGRPFRYTPDTMLSEEWKMITEWRFARSAGIMFLCIGSLQMAYATGENHHKKKVQPQLPALPSGPTGPLQPMPLDSMAPVEPHVTYENGQLTIVAANSTLGDILNAVREQTRAQIEMPDARERVVTHLGPGPAQKIIAELLNGSGFDYVLLGSSRDPSVLTRVILVARSTQAAKTVAPSQPPTAVDVQANPYDTTTANNANADSNGETPGQPDQPATAEQPGINIPGELQVQEMQQSERLHLQQQQFRALPPIPEPVFSVPEINGALGFPAVALLASAILIIRGRREI